MYLTYYVHLVGIKEVIDCKNARCGKLKKKTLCPSFRLENTFPLTFKLNCPKKVSAWHMASSKFPSFPWKLLLLSNYLQLDFTRLEPCILSAISWDSAFNITNKL